LSNLNDKGIDPLTIEAAFNTIEFRLRENNTGAFPRGLLLMLRSLTTWLYDSDPLLLIPFETPLQSIKTKIRSNKHYFEEMIKHLLLQNPHRTTQLLTPEPMLAEKQENADRKRLEEKKTAMGPTELQAVIDNTHQLKKIQKTPDPQEALATIPNLQLGDLAKENKLIPLALGESMGAKILYHDLFTNGIIYLDIGFNLHTLPQHCLPYIPLLGRSFLEMGTKREDFVTLAQRISRNTGGMFTKFFTSMVKDTQTGTSWLFLRCKVLLKQIDELINILGDVLLTVQLDNRERFRQLLLEEKARYEQKLVTAGHRVVDVRLRSHFNEAAWATEQMNGLSYLFFLRNLVHEVDKNWPGVVQTLESMRQILLNRNAIFFNITADEKGCSYLGSRLNNFLDTLPDRPVKIVPWLPKESELFEGISIPTQVNYVGKGANLYHFKYQFHGSILVITHYLETTWLWERVRVQGGAYGVSCDLDRFSGVLTFISYRDPNLLRTVEIFDRTAQFLRAADLNTKELTKSIIGAIGDIDAYMLPDAKGYISMLRYLNGNTDETRQLMRAEILGTTAADFKIFADILDKVKEEGLVKALGSQSAIEDANSKGQGSLKVVPAL
jgi:Zn-dependent M16 (insulinase) family peptidase